MVPQFAAADLLTSVSLEMTNHTISTVADHELLFVTPSGVDASSDTIIIEYASGFDLTSLSAPGDFDLAIDDDGACDGAYSEKTLAASAAGGIWGVSVSSQSITLTAPTDAASGEITAGRCVQIQIGTNAASGVNQIANPGSAASYEVDVYGTFTDVAIMSVSIPALGSTTVSATVPGGGGGSPSTPPTPPVVDTTGPTIASIVVTNITASSADVTFVTDEAALTTVSYGLTTSYEIGDIESELYRTVHTVPMSGLTDGTTYHLQITAYDIEGNSSTSTDVEFTTLDITAPVITNFIVSDITETTATFTWDTDEAAGSLVNLISTIFSVSDVEMVTAHEILVTELVPETTYTAEAVSEDEAGNVSAEMEEGQLIEFTTLADLPPTNVSGLNAVASSGQVDLSWSLPTDGDLTGIMVVRSTTGTPTSPTDGDVVFDGLASAYTDTGLINGVTYFYTVFAYDSAGNLSSGASVSATPASSDPPVIPDPPDEEEEVIPDEDSETPDTPIDTDTPETIIPDSPDDPDSTTGGPESETDVDLPETTVSGEDLIPISDVGFTVARGTIALEPSRSTSAIHVLGGRSLGVLLNMQNITTAIDSVQLIVGTDTYLMNPVSSIVTDSDEVLVSVESEAEYQASVVTPSVNATLAVVISYEDGDVQTIPYDLTVLGEGFIESSDSEVEVGSSTVSIYRKEGDWILFNAPSYAQSNPIITENGLFAWYVPDGTYRVEVSSSGFTPYTSAGVIVHDNIMNPAVELIPVLPAIDEVIEEIFEDILGGDGSATEKAAAVAKVVTKRAVQSVKIVRQDPGVQKTANVAAPVTAVVAASTATTLAVSFNAFRFLQYLVTAPFLLFKRRKRKEWGVVYDSLKKVPVDLAIIRLVDASSGRVVKSQVTDRAGRYLFIAEPGEYKLVVHKPGYTFPTGYLGEAKIDGQFLDLYHGEAITVSEAHVTIAANIPLDPAAAKGEESTKKIQWKKWSRTLQYVLSIVGTIVAILVAVVQPTVWTIVIAVAQVVVLAVFVRLAMPKKPTGWGIVYDSKTRRPLAKTVVRIFDPKFNKLLETQVTDSQGRYAFLVGPSEYYTTYEKKNYEALEVRPIDRTDQEESSYVAINVGLEKK